MIHVLVVETDRDIRNQVQSAFDELGYIVRFAAGYKDAMDEMWHEHIDLVVADYYCDSCRFCSDLREVQNNVPYITLLCDSSPRRKRKIFASKADGYIEVPFDSEELQMRVKNLFWRCQIEESAIVKYGNCRLNTATYSVEAENETVELRRMEFLLLEKLLSYPGRVFTRGQLLDELWGYDCTSDPRTVDTHIKQLRKKLRKVKSIRLLTVRGIGYRAAIPKRFE